MSQLNVSVSPHIRSTRTTQKIMLDVIIALLPTLIAACVLYGMRSLLLTAVSVATCVLGEFVFEKLLKRDITIGDLSAVVTGMLLAFNVPAGMPVWMLIVGSLFAIILGKMLFGGIGCNFMNPALVGRVVMMFSFTTAITTFATPSGTPEILSSATPLALAADEAKNAALTLSNFKEIFLGQYGGTIGETCSLTLILGGIYLCVRKVIKPIIPLCYIGACFVFSFLFGQPAETAFLNLFTGGLLLGAIFMATDYVTSPITNWGKVIFGVFLGFITAVIRVFGNYAEGITFSIILGNILVPYINDLTLPKPIGSIAKKKEETK